VEPAPLSYLLLFEEPELYLHPKAQNILFDALRVFAKEHHVIVTTHSPMFFGPGATETFMKLKKKSDSSIASKPFTQVLPIDLSEMKAKDQFQIICFENNNAAFFAETVVLVEGDSDYLLMPHIAKMLESPWDVAKVPLLFVRITGKGNIRRYKEFFAQFNVRVPVIADLDLLVGGFEQISSGNEVKTLRDRLLNRVDELLVEETHIPTAKEAKDAYDSNELRGLWHRVKECQAGLMDGTGTQADLDQAMEAFLAWQRKSDRLQVLKNSSDHILLQLKWQLLEMLRTDDIFVLERGAIEQYYPGTIVGPDKPSRAMNFCSTVDTRDAILACCGEQVVEIGGIQERQKEFCLIFHRIFEGSRCHHSETCPYIQQEAVDRPITSIA
jgi:hypothetical protein